MAILLWKPIHSRHNKRRQSGSFEDGNDRYPEFLDLDKDTSIYNPTGPSNRLLRDVIEDVWRPKSCVSSDEADGDGAMNDW